MRCCCSLAGQNGRRLTPLTRTPTRIHPDLGAHHRYPTRIDLDEAATGLEGDFAAGFEHYLHAAGQVDFLAGFHELAGAEFDVLVVGDGQMVVGLDLCFAVGMDSVVLFGQQLSVTVGFDAIVAFVANADVLVVLDVLVPVALGVDEDLFFAGLVFDAQFVEAVAAGAAEGFEDAAGFVLGQGVRDLVGLVVEAAGD